jgi:trans-aconitate methyltransferase
MRLQVTPALPEAAMLVRELAAFQVKVRVTTKEEELATWREGTHDDLVLAVAVAAWLGEHALRRLVVFV